MSFNLPDNDQVNFTLEDYDQPDNDAVDFSLEEGQAIDDEDDEPLVGVNPIDLPMSPLNLRSMNVGVSIFLVGMLGVLGGAVGFLQNYAAGIMWAFAIFALIASGLFGIGLELFWAMIGATIFLLMIGMVVRWTT